MKIKIEQPPILNEIRKVFNVPRNAVFTYGDTIYNPANGHIDEHLMRHEETHMRQQEAMGIIKWWDRYLSDADFRLSQEIEAYSNQYKSFCKANKDRNVQNFFLIQISRDLASPMYKVNVGMHRAMHLIRSFK